MTDNEYRNELQKAQGEVRTLQKLLTDQRITYEKEILRVELSALDKQLSTAATELSRRLDVLNHAHEAAIQDRAQFVKSELYEANRKEMAKWRDEVNNALANTAGRSAVWGTVSSLVVGFVVLLIAHFWR